MNIQKTGTIDADIVESNPIVFQGKLYIFEYIRFRKGDPAFAYYGNDAGDSFFRFLDVAENRFTPPFGHGLHMGSAFTDNGKVYVTAVENWGKSRFYLLSSEDLIRWSDPRVILEDPSWAGYNTSCCKADGRYVLTFELGKPKEIVGEPFTMFFAESADMEHFRVIPDAVLFKDIYTGGPMIRYFDRWFYFFYLHCDPGPSYVQRAARSRDLKHWVCCKRDILRYEEADKVIAASANHPEIWRTRAEKAEDINNSDMDMTDFNGNVEITYSWGNQRGNEFLARAFIPDMTEEKFCRSLFEDE